VSLDPSATSIVAVSAAVVGALGLILGVVAQVRLGRLRRSYSVLQGGDGPESIVDSAVRTTKEVEALRADVAGVVAGLEAGDGLVLSSINGRSETRTYAKGVKGGQCEAQLSPEEEQVVGWAFRGKRQDSK